MTTVAVLPNVGAGRVRGGVLDGSLGLRGDVAQDTEKVGQSVFKLENLKAFGNAIHLQIPRIFIPRREPSFAGLSAIGHLSFSTQQSRAIHNMRAGSFMFQCVALPQSN
jgi:hypothetical protein